jgi:chemotaxis protein methyltransferase WspC
MPGVDFDGLLREAIGLDAASLGPSAIARAVAARQAACRLDDVHGYWLRVRSSPSELQELIEAVVVPETWFFRDPAAFEALAAMARQQLIDNPSRELRLLSLPCSSGEEPFSMAIALLEAGVPANRFHIDGIDISARVLALAERASYGINSFRGGDLGFRERHFRAAGHGKWQLSDDVRSRVRFRQGNLFAADFLSGRALYDFVFCRNVLIYFDPETQARAVQVLLRLLAAGGTLFVGPSETSLLPRERFVSAQLPMAFAYHLVDERRATAPTARKRAAAVPPAPKRARRATDAAPKAKAKPVAAAAVAVEKRNPAVAVPDGAPAAGIVAVRQLADAGRLAEARAAGERLLREQGPGADVFCLLGIIRGAEGELDAADALYRKALYLAPEHQESLAHLVLLLESRGRADAACVLRTRMRLLEGEA